MQLRGSFFEIWSAGVAAVFSGGVDGLSAQSFLPLIFASASPNRISAIRKSWAPLGLHNPSRLDQGPSGLLGGLGGPRSFGNFASGAYAKESVGNSLSNGGSERGAASVIG